MMNPIGHTNTNGDPPHTHIVFGEGKMKQRSRFEELVINLLTLVIMLMVLATIGAFWWRFLMKPLLGW